MKKILIIIASAFAFFTFATLLLVAAISNIYGINTDHSGLFPKLEMTIIDDNISSFDVNMRLYDQNFTNQSYTIINRSGKEILIEDTKRYYANEQGNFSFNLYAYGLYFEINGSNIVVKSLPNDYDYYLANDLYYSSGQHELFVETNETYSESFEEDEELTTETTETINLKDGDSYEIKLPE